MNFPFVPSPKPLTPPLNDPRLLSEGPCLESLGVANVVHRNDYFEVKNRGGYFTLETDSHDVVIVPIVEGREVVMLRPYRPVLGDAPLEFPGGGAHFDEMPVATAARELQEETGLKIEDLQRFKPRTPFCLSPNRMPRLHHVFEISISEQEADSMVADRSEIFSVERYSFEEARDLIANGTIYVAAVAGILASLLLSRNFA